MLYHEPQTWIVYWLEGCVLTRITAAEAACGEPEETLDLLALENGCSRDDINVYLEEG